MNAPITRFGDSGNMRYRLLETSRAYAWEKFIERGEQSELAARHARWARAFAENAGGGS